MLDLLFVLLLGHFIGDFAFQTGRMAKLKPTSLLVLTEHVTIYTLTLTGFLYFGLVLTEQVDKFFTWTTLWVMLFVFVEHWCQDLIKGRKFASLTQAFFVDQVLHIVVLYAMRLLIYNA